MTRLRGSQRGTPLTPRQIEILEHAALGQTDKEIADDLVLSPITIHHHFHTIFQKLGVDNRIKAFRELGWLRIAA